MSGPAAAAGASRFQRFMNHPAGPKTVFFWAPLMKWCLVAAGVKDLNRPAEKLSVSQNAGTLSSLDRAGLGAVNFFVGMTGLSQLYRIWERTHPEAAKAALAAPH
ncbi:hypothetical protein FRC17_010814 [Serendipita sp. 399]|nr:hypothetical protein FRC17_010814 [Serendipita sp. 399]